MPYFANINQRGPVRYRDVPGSIGVLEAPDKFMPIGQADCKTWDENGLAIRGSGGLQFRLRQMGSIDRTRNGGRGSGGPLGASELEGQ
jgi:hypothetical protein